MQMIEPTAAASFIPQFALLPRTGWTATASDYNSTPANAVYPPGNVLDGNNSTIWHTVFLPSPIPLPHWITIDMHTIQSVSALLYRPRQDGSLNGTIGSFTISVSLDGSQWGSPVATGTWANDNTQKIASFPGAFARFIRLTATSEAGNRGPWSAAAEIDLAGDPPPDPALPRSGWVATASDYNSTPSTAVHSPNKVLDGNADTLWHSVFVPSSMPLPHWITIDLRTSKTVTGLTYLPRSDAYLNGNIGQYSISVSENGTTWGSPIATGSWADNKIKKTVTFAPVSARYVRLTATSEAGNRGPWSAAAEIDILSPGPSAGIGGKWDAPLSFPLVPVSAIILPNNKLLTFAASSPTHVDTATPTTKVAILDLVSGTVGQMATINTNHQMFCTGLAVLADGRVLIDGGSSDRSTTIYNPTTDTWTVGPLLNIARGYQGDTLLSTGQVLTIGGSWNDSAGGKDAEIFSPSGATGSWARLPNVTATNILTADPAGVFRSDNHPWLFAVSNGGVFHAGPSKQMNWITTTGNGSITSAGLRGDSPDAINGNAAMYDVGKILTVGGATVYQDHPPVVNSQATKRAYVLDISGGPTQPVVTTRVSDMAYARSFGNSVVLPDGKVLVVGGQQHPQAYTDTGAAMSPELWDPATGQFTIMATEAMPRTYHSVAILLPDARVFSGGGGLCGGCTTNHLDGRIFTPPYLLNTDGTPRTRPTITAAPTTAAPGSTITVTTDAPTPTFALIRTSAITHSVNNDQRRIPLVPTTTNGTTHTLQLPADRGVALPGPYMLFALNANGTPSTAKFMTIN